MSNGESTPRRQGQRRRHQRWNGPERDGRAPFFHHYDGLKSSRMSYQPPHSEARRHNHAPVPDELSLELMSQDCSLVKNQLLRLKNLLQLEDTADSTANVAGEIEGNSNGVAQFEELLKEVHALREELRSRDKTIVQLTLQCQQLQQHQQEQALARERQVRCQCQRQRAPSLLRPPGDKRLQRPCDKATQTYWRTPGHALQIPFNFSERFRPGRPVKILPTEARSDQTKDTRARFDADAPLDDLTSYVADLLRPSQCPSSPAATRHDPVAAAAPSLRGEGASLPAVKPLRHSLSSETFAGKTRQLPPPTRGLPCFNSGPRQQVFTSCGTSSLLLRRISEPRGGANPENADREPLKETAKMIAPLGRSCLPKPKIP